MQDGQYCAIGGRIEKFVGMPRGRQRSGLRLTIADYASDDQLRIIKDRSKRVTERIAQFAALVDRARALRGGVAGNSSGKGKLKKKLPQTALILADVWIDLAVSALKISVAYDRRPAVAGTGDVDHVEIVFFDDPVQVRVNEILSRGRAPMSEQHVLHVGQSQRTLQKRIVVEINLADR